MLTDTPQPFLGPRAFVKDTSDYVTFPSQSDAMLASLQLFHDVPCRIMELIFSVITHPGFKASQVSLASSVGIIRTVEEARLKDRMVVVHERSRNNQRIGLPPFVLEEVLDILAAERAASIKARFEKDIAYGDMNPEIRRFRPEEGTTLSDMSLVHRSWTFSVQKALGRSIYIGRALEDMDLLLRSPPDMSVYGPWTSLVAIDLYHPWVKRFGDIPLYPREEYLRWLETLHRILVRFTNIKCIYMRSHFSRFTEWFNITIRDMIRQTTSLEELILNAFRFSSSDQYFDLKPLFQSKGVFENIRSLNVRGALLSDVGRDCFPLQGSGFANLRNLTLEIFSVSLRDDLSVLSFLSTQSNIHLESMQIHVLKHTRLSPFAAEYEFLPTEYLTQAQCISLFQHIRTLRIVCDYDEKQFRWLKWMGPYCLDLKYLTIATDLRHTSWPSILETIPRITESLNLQLEANSDSACDGWTQTLLGLPELNLFPEMKSLVLTFRVRNVVRTEVFDTQMKEKCSQAGIRFASSYTSGSER